MKFLLFALCLSATQCSYSQASQQHDTGVVYSYVPNPPFFFQGALADYVKDNIHYPDSARVMGYEGRVIVSFVVDEQGDVRDAVVTRGVNRWLDEEALRIVRAMPRWAPGHKDGNYIKVRLTLPVRFVLGKPEESQGH